MTPDQLDRVLAAQRDTEVARDLVRSYLPLVQRISGRVASRYHVDPRELVGAGTCALYEALRGWREDGGANFTTYAWQWVWKRVIQEAQAITSVVPRGVQCDDDSDRERRTACQLDVTRAVLGLPADQQHFLVAVYVRGQSLGEASDAYGVHRHTGRSIRDRACRRLEQYERDAATETEDDS